MSPLLLSSSSNRIRELLDNEGKLITKKLLEGLNKIKQLQSLVDEVNWLGDEASKSSATYFCKDVEQIFMDNISSFVGVGVGLNMREAAAAQSEITATSIVDTKMPPDEEIVTATHNGDESQWKKYGSKMLAGGHYKRYYKCSNSGCHARKSVEQQKNDEDPSKFKVIYLEHHTCKTNNMCPIGCYISSPVVTDECSLNENAKDTQQEHRNPDSWRPMMLMQHDESCSSQCSSSTSPIRSDLTSTKRARRIS